MDVAIAILMVVWFITFFIIWPICFFYIRNKFDYKKIQAYVAFDKTGEGKFEVPSGTTIARYCVNDLVYIGEEKVPFLENDNSSTSTKYKNIKEKSGCHVFLYKNRNKLYIPVWWDFYLKKIPSFVIKLINTSVRIK